MAYFTLTRGLRGCYMPDDVQELRVLTRRALREIVEDEARWLDGGNGRPRGLSQRAVSSYVAEVWRRRDALRLPLALPYGDGHSAIMLSTSCRADYLAARDREDY